MTKKQIRRRCYEYTKTDKKSSGCRRSRHRCNCSRIRINRRAPKSTAGQKCYFAQQTWRIRIKERIRFLSPMARVITVTIIISAVLPRTWILAVSYWSLNSVNSVFVTIIETVNWAYKGDELRIHWSSKDAAPDRHQKSNTAADECTHSEKSAHPQD